jgi:hypothetical protein
MENILFKKYFDQKYDQLNFLKDLKLFDLENKIMDINIKLDSLNKKNSTSNNLDKDLNKEINSLDDLNKIQERSNFQLSIQQLDAKIIQLESKFDECNKRFDEETAKIMTDIENFKDKTYKNYKVLKERINDLTKNNNLLKNSNQELVEQNKKLQQGANFQQEEFKKISVLFDEFKKNLTENINNQMIELNNKFLDSTSNTNTQYNLRDNKKRKMTSSMSKNQMIIE